VSRRRLFFALWPEEQTRVVLARLVENCLPVGVGRPIVPTNLHVTLVFLGDVGENTQRCVEDLGNKIAHERFVLTLDRLGYWAKPQVQWLGTKQCSGELAKLVECLKKGLMACGFKLVQRPFIPHLTLKRKVRKRPPISSMTPICWHVNDFALVESCFVPGGVEYHVRRIWPLK